MKVSKAALVAATMTGGSTMLMAAPAFAQYGQSAQQPAAQPAQPGQPTAQQPQRMLTLNRREQTALAPLNRALTARDWTAAQAALPAAQAAAQTPDARYFVARAMWRIADGTQNRELEAQALDALLATTATPASERPIYLNRQAELAFAANDFAKAEQAFTQLLQLTPNDTRIQNNLRIVQQRRGNTAGAAQTVFQSIQAAEASGGRAAQEMYLNALRLVYGQRDRTRSIEYAGRLAQNYPTPGNWRDAIRVYRQLAQPDDALTLDSLRLARAAGGMEGADEYRFYVAMLDQAALPGEAKAVIDEGVARGALRANDPAIARALATANRRIAEDRAGLDAQIREARNAPTARATRVVADALYGYGRYAEAAELYRVAAGKPGEDRNLLNLRLGAALAMAGQRAEAETVLRAVTGDPADLAKLWLAWLGRRAG